MERLIIMDAILSWLPKMALFSRTYINDSMALMEIILTSNITLTQITFHRVLEKGEGSLLTKARFNESSPDFGDERHLKYCCATALKSKEILLGCLMILFLVSAGASNLSSSAKIEMPTTWIWALGE